MEVFLSLIIYLYHLFNHVFVIIRTHGYLLCAMGCNPMLLYFLFVAQIVSVWSMGALSIGLRVL